MLLKFKQNILEETNEKIQILCIPSILQDYSHKH